jgi:hypothetical protein
VDKGNAAIVSVAGKVGVVFTAIFDVVDFTVASVAVARLGSEPEFWHISAVREFPGVAVKLTLIIPDVAPTFTAALQATVGSEDTGVFTLVVVKAL